jgi:hypothetical protein
MGDAFTYHALGGGIDLDGNGTGWDNLTADDYIQGSILRNRIAIVLNKTKAPAKSWRLVH